jgi:Glyoxalase-like domain
MRYGDSQPTRSMHRSRLAGFIIDCRTDDLPAAAEFWGAALGFEVRALAGQEDQYVQLVDPADRLHVEVQRVSHPSRVHLDIESDDVDAEVERLERLGAKRVQKIHTWWVMEAPTGQRFCVVRAKAESFTDDSNTWS